MTQRIYKFLKSSHAETFARNGELVLSSLAFFEHWETVWGQRGIGDETEGVSKLTIIGARDPGAEPHLFKGLVEGTVPAGTVTFENCISYTPDPHALIFSTAVGELRDLSSLYGRFGYAAAVEITDPRGFCEALMAEGVVLQSGRPLSDLLKSGTHRPVYYGVKTRDVAEIIRPQHGPFVKATSFEDQREYRFHFEAVSNRVADRIKVRIPHPERFLAKDIHEIEASPQPPPGPSIINDPISSAARLLANARRDDPRFRVNRTHLVIRALGKDPQDWTSEEKARIDRMWDEEGRRDSVEFSNYLARYSPDVLKHMWAIRLQCGIREGYNLPYRPGVAPETLGDLLAAVGRIGAGEKCEDYFLCEEFHEGF